MTTELRIDRQFRGPTGSGNGGWTAGTLAEHLRSATGHDGPVEVTLRQPPPLDTALTIESDATTARLLGPVRLVAEAVVAEPSALGDPVEPVDAVAARAAEADYAGLRHHPYPQCFTCGPDRTAGDGLLIFPGLIAPGRTACTWTPHPAMAAEDGRLGPEYVWAALDCPGGWTEDLDGRPVVLGRMTAQVFSRPLADRVHVAVGRQLDVDGRKTRTATTVYDASGRMIGQAAQVWIAVDPATFA
ncbi:MAG TPA: hypothetical protein VEX15_12690 [Nocardioidaceae bacterium]|nr:hypothetical protein [Nocardioidaceae bacterium]